MEGSRARDATGMGMWLKQTKGHVIGESGRFSGCWEALGTSRLKAALIFSTAQSHDHTNSEQQQLIRVKDWLSLKDFCGLERWLSR